MVYGIVFILVKEWHIQIYKLRFIGKYIKNERGGVFKREEVSIRNHRNLSHQYKDLFGKVVPPRNNKKYPQRSWYAIAFKRYTSLGVMTEGVQWF